MSLQQIMDAAQGLGRGEDSLLVHMAPNEVNSLQRLAEHHGGSLTINPTTGLPEAGFLSSILPAIVGGALSVASGGTLSPLMIAGITGAGTGLVTGSLEKGLMAGLGAFGGAGVGSGLMNLGASTALPGAVDVGAQLGAGASTLPGSAMPALGGSMETAGLGSLTGGLDAAPGIMPGLTPTSPVMPIGELAQPSFGQSIANNFSDFGAGVGKAFADPAAGLEALGGVKGLATAGLTALAPAMLGGRDKPQQKLPEQDLGMIRPYTYTQVPNENRQPGQRYFDSRFTAGTPQPARGFQGFAEGGITDVVEEEAKKASPQGDFSFVQERLADDPSMRRFDQHFVANTPAPSSGGLGFWNGEWPPKDPFAGMNIVEQMKRWGEPELQQQALMYDLYTGRPRRQHPFLAIANAWGMDTGNNRGYGGYAGGGEVALPVSPHLTQGAGDGMSDSIPAVIDGVRPAALATDEFVIPADVVSQLGNGSTNAGAKELHAMMDRVRRAAHGSTRQQRQINPTELMPA